MKLLGLILQFAICCASCDASSLKWDYSQKDVAVRANDTNAVVRFWVTNAAPNTITIERVRLSCGCSVIDGPRFPWTIQAFSSRELKIATDLRGRRGILHKTATVRSSAGIQVLNFNIQIGMQTSEGERTKNQILARADPQAVFQSGCAKCHATPTEGKVGPELYKVACGICHEAEHRASMVPDISGRRLSRDQWKSVIARGRPNSLMPAFHKSKGGPLTERQIDSLVNYLIDGGFDSDRNQ